MSITTTRQRHFDPQTSETAALSESFILKRCKVNGGYSSPELNEKIYLPNLSISRLGGFSAFTGCRVLYLQYNAISDLSALAHLLQLDSLYVSHNALQDLHSLPRLPQLRVLDVSHNHLTTLDVAGHHAPSLEVLLTSHNHIKSLTGLLECRSLVSLDVSHNLLAEEAAVFVVLEAISGSLRTLMLHGSELSRRSSTAYRKRCIALLPQLRFLDEYPVFVEERERAEAFQLGGAEAEAAVKRTQWERELQEKRERFVYYGDLREVHREARRLNGPNKRPTEYFLLQDADEDDDTIYVPTV